MESTVAALRQVLTMYKQCGKTTELAAELRKIWAEEFADSHDRTPPVDSEDDGAGVSGSGADASRAEGRLAAVAQLKEDAAKLTAARDSAEAKVAELQRNIEDGASKLETAEKAATDSAAEVVALTKEVETLKVALESARSQAASITRNADEPGSAMPADAQALFDKAKAAEDCGDKPAALTAYQAGVKTAMAYLTSHPAAKSEVTPVLQRIMKHAQELKKELVSAKKPESENAELPAHLEEAFAAAQAADREGNEKEAVALYEGAAKTAMAFIKTPEGAAQKAALTPTLTKFIARARELKQI
eukprot:SAG31_NODE_7808_length_1592_cov_1.148024_1_plen_303_part_00